MNELFFESHTLRKTCSVNGVLLHSQYDPVKEAQRFVQTIETKTEPLYVIITGASLSYCVPFLRSRFPAAKLAVVQFSHAFSDADNLWDAVMCSEERNIAEKLYDFVGEENWGASLFVSWKPSETAWPDEFEKTWRAIRDASVKCRNVIATRSYFNRRWLKNCIRFCLELDKTVLPEPGDKPIIIAASGPSLADSLKNLKKYRDSFFLLALSSAATPLAKAGICPDLLITSDGGYWAKAHLHELEFLFPATPIAAPFEAALPSHLITRRKIIPLAYEDGADVRFAQLCGITAIKAERNGTVSGTAAELALRLSTNSVFFCGLDLASNPAGLSHTQPNALETIKRASDARLYPAETRHAAQTGTNTALDIYASWFSSRNDYFNSRVFRLRGKTPPLRNLFPLRDVYWEAVLKAAGRGTKKIEIHGSKSFNKNERKTALAVYFDNCLKQITDQTPKTNIPLVRETDFWLKSAQLGLYLQYKRGNAEVFESLRSESISLINNLRNIIDRHE